MPAAILPRTTGTMAMLANLAMTAGCVLMLLGAWHGNDLPDPAQVLPELAQWPAQRARERPPFQVTAGEVTYTVEPLYDYDIQGLVVSRHSATGFTDITHAEARDHLNVVDLCLVYGDLARSGAYRNYSYSSGNWTCYVHYEGNSGPFATEELSNNHLLTEDPTVAAQLRDLRIGDQVRIRGYLARYSHQAFGSDHPFTRGTSTTRADTGNGACETLYVRDMEVLRRADAGWRAAMWTGIVLLAGGLAAWLVLPARLRER